MKSTGPRGLWESCFDDTTIYSTWGWRWRGCNERKKKRARWHRLQEVYLARLEKSTQNELKRWKGNAEKKNKINIINKGTYNEAVHPADIPSSQLKQIKMEERISDQVSTRQRTSLLILVYNNGDIYWPGLEALVVVGSIIATGEERGGGEGRGGKEDIYVLLTEWRRKIKIIKKKKNACKDKRTGNGHKSSPCVKDWCLRGKKHHCMLIYMFNHPSCLGFAWLPAKTKKKGTWELGLLQTPEGAFVIGWQTAQLAVSSSGFLLF